MGAFRGASYDVFMKGGTGCSIVMIDALSSSSMPDNVIRSEYKLTSEVIRLMEGSDMRMVSASELELIVDMVLSETRSESECEDAKKPASSCL